jgi:hypothetical protein
MNYSYIERCLSSVPFLYGVSGLKELLGSEVCRRQSNWKILIGDGREVYWKGSVVRPMSNTECQVSTAACSGR